MGGRGWGEEGRWRGDGGGGGEMEEGGREVEEEEGGNMEEEGIIMSCSCAQLKQIVLKIINYDNISKIIFLYKH